jgi:ABC-type antimicrobial peptide transport system permease subunit
MLALAVVAGLARGLPYLVPSVTLSHAGSFGLALAALTAVALLAALIPASRAARVNPSIALRAE